MLIKLQGTIENTYWTIMDVLGNIREMPKEMQKLLSEKEWNAI